jgi:hypothetical protein
MTASIEDLLREKAEKERLEQQLRIARSIQMSLLPQGPFQMPGVTLVGYCEPAREVGGDYYDFLPLDGDRLGILIADVAGKGTSAALYMAELKGLMLSLSQLHLAQTVADRREPHLQHLVARSFIDDLRDRGPETRTSRGRGRTLSARVRARTARRVAGGANADTGRDGLGLQFDTGDAFDRMLEEITLPWP